MCLIVDKENFKIEVAQEDIVCYKVLIKRRNGDIVSPFQGFVYEIGKKYKTRMKHFYNSTYCKITEGFHSFLKEEGAWREKMLLQDFYITYVCFRCVIPKGSKIVYGIYNAKDAIVSETIKIIEEV